jgi:TolB-like protein
MDKFVVLVVWRKSLEKKMKKTLLLTLFIAVFIYVPTAECRTKISVFRLKPAGGREAEDISRAVQDILVSQLLEKDVVLPVAHDYVPVDDRDAASRALKEVSDYAVTGGIAILGKSSNISIRLVDSKTSVPVHAESRQISRQEDIPDILAQMAKSIKAAVSTNEASSPDVRIPGTAVLVPEKKSAGTTEDAATLDSVEKILLFRTDNVDERIISIAPVERSRNGHELIALTRNQIMIYKKTGKKLEMTANSEAQAGQRNLRVDTGDTDGNGIDEIFITGINTAFNSPVSSIYEIKDGRPSAVSSESGFFTASVWRNCHKVVLKQREDNGSRLYQGDIFQISGKSREAVKAPSGIFLDNFISGRITEKKSEMWLAFDSSDKLELINENGEAEWQGDEKFGGSMESIEKPMEAGKREDTERKYFRQRMIGFCDNSGKTYVITAKNEDMAKGLLSGFKKFTSGRIVILGWSDIGLKEIWASEKIPGGIHDIALFDADGDGLKDVVIASSIETTFKSKGFLAGIKLPENIAKMIK